MSSREPLVLVFDCGTQSTRAFLFNKKGDILAKVKLSVEPYFSTQAGYAEKNTDDYWASVCEVSKKLKEKSGDLWNDIIACSITTLRAVFVCLDKNNKPLRPSITWLDQRKATKFDKMPLINKFLFRLVGMHEAVKQQRKISTANWIKQFEPEIWAKTDKFVFESAYLNYKLCGEVCDSMASIIGRIPYDYKHFKWMTEKSLNYHIFGAEIDKMCPLKKPGELMGYITKEASLQTGIKEGLPIITTGSDKACETLGVGCLDRDVASLSFGTTATVQTTTDK
ncbi:MAG: FGGY family carbohydrate kinase, partial [Clostridia bacterium]